MAGGEMTDEEVDTPDGQVDLEAHAARAVGDYESVIGQYEDYARTLRTILDNSMRDHDLPIHSITHRAKTSASFLRKAAKASADNPSTPRYSDPLDQITDKAGVRITTYFLAQCRR